MKNEINFERFCALHKRLLVNPVKSEDLHNSYVEYKKTIRAYHYSVTEWIILEYGERTIEHHGNCLKRNKNKVEEPEYKVTSESLTEYLNSNR